MLLGLYVFLVIALPLALGIVVVINGLPRSRRCPGCAAQTVRLQSRALATASRPLRTQEVHARWCPTCGWEGAAILSREPALVAPRPSPTRLEPSDGGSSDGLALRRIDLDGDDWRVLLEAWNEAGQWHGRLRFVSPQGRSWAEDAASLRGSSALDVLTQALGLSDRSLAGRIRRATR